MPPVAGAVKGVAVAVVVAVQKSAGKIVICFGATMDSERVVGWAVDTEICEDWILEDDCVSDGVNCSCICAGGGGWDGDTNWGVDAAAGEEGDAKDAGDWRGDVSVTDDGRLIGVGMTVADVVDVGDEAVDETEEEGVDGWPM